MGQPWIVRFEDIDLPRVVPGARERQLEDLAALGLVPDEIVLQSGRRERHYELFESAASDGRIYPCACSRREVQEALAGIASAPHGALPIYTGNCRRSPARGSENFPGPGGIAWRFRDETEHGYGDFIVARTATGVPDESSFVPAYHWACAIDDFDGRYALLVRAWDLADSTPLQRKVQAWIAGREGIHLRFPAVFHTSLVVDDDGHRLEKRTQGVTLPEYGTDPVMIAKIINRFRASFRSDTASFEIGAVFGESSREMRLAQLGF